MSEPEPTSGVLQMGVSVGVNDEKRRMIVDETQNIGATCETLLSNEASENLISKEMEKHSKRQENEMSNMRDGTVDVFQSIQMNEGILAQLMGTFNTNILQKHEHRDESPDDVEPEETVSYAIAFQEAMVEKSDRSAEKEHIAGEKLRAVGEVKSNIQDIFGELEYVLHNVESENLPGRVANAKEKTQEAQDTEEAEKEKLRVRSENYATAIERSNAAATAVEAEKQAVESAKLELKTKKTELQEALGARKSNKKDHLEAVKALQDQLAKLTLTYSELDGGLGKAKEIIVARKNIEQEYTVTRSERSTIFEEKLVVEVNAANESTKLKLLRSSFQEAEAKKGEMLAKKKETDKKDAERLPNAIAEKKVEVEQVERQLEISKDALDQRVADIKEALATEAKNKVECHDEMLLVAEETTEKLATQKKFQDDVDAERSLFETKHAEMQGELLKTEEANTVTAKEIEEKVESEQVDVQQKYIETLRKCKVLKIASKYLEKETKAVEKLAAAKSAMGTK